MTKKQLENKKVELEQWLRDNSSEHEAVAVVTEDLRRVTEKLARKDYA